MNLALLKEPFALWGGGKHYPEPRLLKPDVFCCLEKGVFAIN